jgi:hypothetical protein
MDWDLLLKRAISSPEWRMRPENPGIQMKLMGCRVALFIHGDI